MTTLYPSEAEFALGPLAYIESVSHEVASSGVAHIVPPASWDPPTLAIRSGVDGINESSFRFGVRIQPTSALCHRRPNRPGAVFGFVRGSRTYTLREFEARCRDFNERYFDGEAAPSVEEVEEAFWRIVGEKDGAEKRMEVFAEYGSDLDNIENGSGFPMPRGLRMDEFNRRCVQDRVDVAPDSAIDVNTEAYRSHPWNVNNFSLHPRSVLSYLVDEAKEDPGLVSGVMVPWLYVGSTFAAFNWHIEDHGLYSVNYLHEGAPKVWYCVPPDQSDAFEVAMRDALPELFDASPDLLSQLVTQLDPRELRARGVDVYRVVHTPGSFIVTMPNTYHTGFNVGFNVAESSNFAALPWLPHSKAVVAKYAEVGRSRPVSISHDMLLVRIIERCREPDIVLVAKRELRLRIAELSEWWVAAMAGASRCSRQQPATDEADCAVCETDLWLVACVVGDTMVCLKHAVSSSNDDLLVSYRYTLEELTLLCN